MNYQMTVALYFFQVLGVTQGYELLVSDFHGKGTDMFSKERPGYQLQFETRDHTADVFPDKPDTNCVTYRFPQNLDTKNLGSGGWWFTKTSSTFSSYNYGCGRANLNGKIPYWQGYKNIKYVEMKIRQNM